MAPFIMQKLVPLSFCSNALPLCHTTKDCHVLHYHYMTLQSCRYVLKRQLMRSWSATWYTTAMQPATLGNTTAAIWTWIKLWRRMESKMMMMISIDCGWTTTSSSSVSISTLMMISLKHSIQSDHAWRMYIYTILAVCLKVAMDLSIFKLERFL